MFLGVLELHGHQTAVALYPLVLGGVAIIASIIGTYFVRTSTRQRRGRALQGLIASGVIAAAAFYPVTSG